MIVFSYIGIGVVAIISLYLLGHWIKFLAEVVVEEGVIFGFIIAIFCAPYWIVNVLFKHIKDRWFR